MKNMNQNKNERGQSLVELSISLIAIFTLLAGAVDFGIALYSFVALRDAAQEGALYGSIDPTNSSGIEERAKSSSSTPVDLQNDATVISTIIITAPNPDAEVLVSSASSTDACEGNGNLIRVDVSFDYHLIMPILPEILGITEIPLTASVTDVILQPRCG